MRTISGIKRAMSGLFQFIAAMTRPSGSWNDIPRRLKRHFGTVHYATPDDQLLDHIFTATAASYFSNDRDFTAEVQQVVVRLVPLTRRLWHATKVSIHTITKRHHLLMKLLRLSIFSTFVCCCF